MGSRALLHHRVGRIERGVYLGKSLRTLSDRMFAILSRLGHTIVAWDEESLVRPPDEVFYRIRLSPKTLAATSLLMTWGKDDARVFRDYPHSAGAPIRVTGNPRIDLLRPELRGYFSQEIAALRARYGDFLLINTNFPRNNHFLPSMSEFSAALEVDPYESRDPFECGNAAHCEALLKSFLEMIPQLAQALPDHPIVVRPHPSESHLPWQRIADAYPKVVVVHQGNVAPWLMACRALIHNGCTTAVESAVLGTPTVAFQPVRSEPYDMHLPNSLSHRCLDLESLVAKLRTILCGETSALTERERRRIFDRHVATLEGPLAADRMLNAIEEVGCGEWPPQRLPVGRYLSARLHLETRTLVKKINMRRRGHRNSLDFHAHRFPGIGLDELRERIARLSAQLGRFKRVSAKQVSEHIFQLSH